MVVAESQREGMELQLRAVNRALADERRQLDEQQQGRWRLIAELQVRALCDLACRWTWQW